MKRTIKALVLCLVVIPIMANAQEKASYHDWWNEGYWDPSEMIKPKKLPLVSVEGARFIANGKPLLFRGLSISDPDKIEKQGHWGKAHFEQVKEFGANLVRIPVHPIAWRERGKFTYLNLLKQAVNWCTELDMYVIIDWHSIGNLKTEQFQAPMYDTSLKETYAFWRMIAKQFSGNNTVAFYEVFNEPTIYNEQLGRISWHEWKEINEEMIAVIRSFDKETVPLVAGFNWAYNLNYIKIDPINAQNIGYTTHPYADKRPQPWEARWEENFAFAAATYPLLATEIGFEFENEENYGERIVTFLESKNISWSAWIFDPEWWPGMISNWDYDLTTCGTFFKKAMSANKKITKSE